MPANQNTSNTKDSATSEPDGCKAGEGKSPQAAELNAAASRLLRLLGAERFVHLPDLIEEIQRETGFGDITIVVAERRVVRLKAEKSY
jgi:hypothetical protein